MITRMLGFIGGLFQWGLKELGARSISFHGGFGYKTLKDGKPHTVTFRGEAPYWGREMADLDPDDGTPHRAHYGIPGVAMVELEWD